jgi:hypothetical protein
MICRRADCASLPARFLKKLRKSGSNFLPHASDFRNFLRAFLGYFAAPFVSMIPPALPHLWFSAESPPFL